MKKRLHISFLLTATIMLAGLSSFGQSWSENFESYSNLDNSFKSEYTCHSFNLATSDGTTIGGKSAYSGTAINPSIPTVLNPGYFQMKAGKYSVNFIHQTINMFPSPYMKVMLDSVNGNEIVTMFDLRVNRYATINSQLLINCFTFRITWLQAPMCW